MLIGRGKPAGTLDWGHMSLPRVVERGGRGRQVVIFCLLTLIVGRRNDDVDRSQDLFFLGWWPLLFSLEWWGRSLVRGAWFPSYLQLEGTDRIKSFGP
jgi:hypothetical protein